jgi:hypothetical protein
MFTPTWAVILTIAGQVHTGVIPEPKPLPTKAACEEHIESHAERMKDWVRGSANVHWDAKAQVKGTCEAAGEPT